MLVEPAREGRILCGLPDSVASLAFVPRMRLAGVAGAIVMLVPCLVGCGGSDETTPEQDMRSQIRRALGLPDDARLGSLECGKVVPLDMLACETTVEGARGGRYLVVRTARGIFAVNREGASPRG